MEGKMKTQIDEKLKPPLMNLVSLYSIQKIKIKRMVNIWLLIYFQSMKAFPEKTFILNFASMHENSQF